MQERRTQPDPVPTPKTGRDQPIPLADRRRLFHPQQQDEAEPTVFTDWAAI